MKKQLEETNIQPEDLKALHERVLHQRIFEYLQNNSSTKDVYEAWKIINLRLFGGKLKPAPIFVGGVAAFGKARCAWTTDADCIHIDSKSYESNYLGKLIHQMCHFLDQQEGAQYEKAKGFNKGDFHNTQAWCDRINSVMTLSGDNRIAFPHKRHGGEMTPVKLNEKTGKWQVITEADIPEGHSVIPWEELGHWELSPTAIQNILSELEEALNVKGSL